MVLWWRYHPWHLRSGLVWEVEGIYCPYKPYLGSSGESWLIYGRLILWRQDRELLESSKKISFFTMMVLCGNHCSICSHYFNDFTKTSMFNHIKWDPGQFSVQYDSSVPVVNQVGNAVLEIFNEAYDDVIPLLEVLKVSNQTKKPVCKASW